VGMAGLGWVYHGFQKYKNIYTQALLFFKTKVFHKNYSIFIKV